MWLYTLRPHVSCITNITIPFDRIAYTLLGLLAIGGNGLVFNVRKISVGLHHHHCQQGPDDKRATISTRDSTCVEIGVTVPE